MNTKRRWYELLLSSVIACLLLGAGAVQTANAYQYEQDEDWDTDYYEYESGFGAWAYTNPEASSGSCSCSAIALTGTEGDSCYASASCYGWYMIWWTWNGPPGEAPGGSLSWSVGGSGSASASGSTSITYPGDEATSCADADSDIWGSGTEGSANGSGAAWGSVSDYELGSCGTSAYGDPEDDFEAGEPEEDETYGGYSASISWSLDSGDSESIPSGTTSVYFDGGADCSGSSSSNGTGSGEASGDGNSSASVSVGASFS